MISYLLILLYAFAIRFLWLYFYRKQDTSVSVCSTILLTSFGHSCFQIIYILLVLRSSVPILYHRDWHLLVLSNALIFLYRKHASSIVTLFSFLQQTPTALFLQYKSIFSESTFLIYFCVIYMPNSKYV